MDSCSNLLISYFRSLLLSLFLLMPMLHAAHADEMADRAEINRNVQAWVTSKNYTQLEATASSYLNSTARTSSGLWKIDLYDFAIGDAFFCRCTDETFWNQAESIVNDWIKQFPNSPNAHLARARMLLSKAWSYRGKGFRNTVDPKNWKLFFENVEKSRVYLTDHKELAASDPRWDNMLIEIANLQDIAEPEFSALANVALDRHPDYYPIYFGIMLHYTPKWGGNAASIEKFAREAVNRSRSTEGEGMYARIYWYAAQSQYGNGLFLTSSVDWQEMKRGIDDVLKAYPDQWNINNFAKFGCISRDKEKTAELIREMSGDPIPDAWGDHTIFENCKTWALTE